MKRVLLYSRQICLKNKQSSSRLKEILLAKNSTKILISKINILTSYCVYLIDYCVIFQQQTPELPLSSHTLPFMKSSFLPSLLPSKEISNASGNFMASYKRTQVFSCQNSKLRKKKLAYFGYLPLLKFLKNWTIKQQPKS